MLAPLSCIADLLSDRLGELRNTAKRIQLSLIYGMSSTCPSGTTADENELGWRIRGRMWSFA